MKIVAGNSNLPLARAIAGYLELPLTDASIRRFADEEVFVEIHENVRGEDVFVVQSTGYPSNDNLMELLICIDALRRASAKRITAVVPYFGYARQDRKPGPRTPISAKLVANLITTAGADRVLAVDLHAGQIQGFFDIPTDNLYGAPVMAADILSQGDSSNVMVVSPDVGGVVRARALAKRIRAGAVTINHAFDIKAPFGGYKTSGNGREWGEDGFTDFLETKAILGYIALMDASPLVIAKEKGIFAKHGVGDVEVNKQASWGATRDNLVLGGEKNGIDGAHILTPMPYLISAGKVTQNNVPTPMYLLARLNLDAQAISVSNEYKDLKVTTDPKATTEASRTAATGSMNSRLIHGRVEG